MGVENYFSTAYEQRQDGLAEWGVESTLNLTGQALPSPALQGNNRTVLPTAQRIAEM